MQEIYKKFGNLVPNEMQNKIAESYDKNLKNLDEFKPIKTQLDDYLKPHNDMEGQNDLLTENEKRGQKSATRTQKNFELRFEYAAYDMQDFGFGNRQF